MSRMKTLAKAWRKRKEAELAQQQAELIADMRTAVALARTADARAAKLAGRCYAPKPGHGKLWELFRSFESSNKCLWWLTTFISFSPDELAMMAQAIDRKLTGTTDGDARDRHVQATYTKKHRPNRTRERGRVSRLTYLASPPGA